MMNFSFNLADEKITQKLGAYLARHAQASDFIALFGDLGAGKTTFSRGFISELANIEDVPSPTFTLLQSYDCELGEICHFDLYRLESPDEIWELGWEELGDKIALVEWPERAQNYLPKNRLEVHIEFNAASRIANISIFGNENYRNKWQNQLESILHEFV